MADRPDPMSTETADAAQPQAEETAAPVDQRARRRRLLGILAAAVGVAALLWLAWHFLVGVNRVSTENAYVGADTAVVTPLVAGAVQSVRVANTQMVRKGDILVTIDPADARIAVDRAAADLAQAERQYDQTRLTGGGLSAQIAARNADITRAQAEYTEAQANLAKAQTDYDRRNRLNRFGAVSGDELTASTTALAGARAQINVARAAIAQAQANRAAAEENVAANRALTRGTRDANPDVAAARTRLAQARLDLARTVIRAPISGVIAQRQVQVGQRIAAGAQILSIVPLDAMYVDANFKEGQLGKVRPGQPVRLESDLYGGDVEYHGRVVGFAGGTGSAFALIPAQNATGNWIKVVQRVPVRIALDRNELAAHPLRVGLSMSATVDVSR